MVLSDEIIEKLLKLKREVEKIEDHVNFNIFGLNDIEEGQIGYSVDQDGNSLVSVEEGAWKAEWIVIGYETLCGDPIIIDTNEAGFPVSSLMHGMGDWDGGIYLSKSLEKFTCEVEKINKFICEKAEGKTVPMITCESLDNLVNEIISEDEYGDIESWKSMLDPIYESTKQYEKSLAKKVGNMSEDGMKIKDISVRLNMSAKDTYRYLKMKNED